MAAPFVTPASADTEVDTDHTLLSFTANSTLSLTVSEDSLAIVADEDNRLYTASTTVTATTNYSTGCSIQIASSSSTTTDLVNSDANDSIPSITSAVTAANFDTNHWAFHSSAETADLYRPIPAESSAYSVATRATAGTLNPDITFGVKANKSKAAGTYNASVTFTAIGN